MEHFKRWGKEKLFVQGSKNITTHMHACLKETGLLKPVSNPFLFLLEGERFVKYPTEVKKNTKVRSEKNIELKMTFFKKGSTPRRFFFHS